MKTKITSTELLDKLNSVDLTPIEKKNKKKNLYILNSPKGQIRVWSDLEPKEFIKSIKKK